MPWDQDNAMTSSYYLALCLVLVVFAVCLVGKLTPAQTQLASFAQATHHARCVLWGDNGTKR